MAPDDLLTPRGDLEAALLWPALSKAKVTEKLTEFCADAARKTTGLTAGDAKTEAQKQWAYYRAYKEVYRRLSITPGAADVRDEASRSYDADQRSRVKALMDEALAAYLAIAEEEDAEEDEAFPAITSLR